VSSPAQALPLSPCLLDGPWLCLHCCACAWAAIEQEQGVPTKLNPALPACLSSCCSFPAAHVLMRLEQAAAGSWLVHTGVVQGSGRLLQAMVTACKGSHDAVVRVYEALLR
jgi:hypothetical protein